MMVLVVLVKFCGIMFWVKLYERLVGERKIEVVGLYVLVKFISVVFVVLIEVRKRVVRRLVWGKRFFIMIFV